MFRSDYLFEPHDRFQLQNFIRQQATVTFECPILSVSPQ